MLTLGSVEKHFKIHHIPASRSFSFGKPGYSQFFCVTPASLAAGRLAGTGGITSVDGSAGGGINPWAVIAGQETNDQIGGTAAYTYVDLPNYGLHDFGAAIGLYDRLELSFAHQQLTLGRT
jgi:hypothetical protein